MFEDALSNLSDEQLDTLARRDLGVMGFEAAVPHLRRVRELIGVLNDTDPDDLASDLVGQANAQVSDLVNFVGRIRDFNPNTGSNPGSDRSALINQVRATRQWFAQHVGPYARLNQVDLERMQTTTAEAAGRIEQYEEKAARLVDEIQKRAGVALAARHSGYYDGQARRHAMSAMAFLLTSIASLGVSVWVAYQFFVVAPPAATESWVVLAREVLPRLFFVGAGAFVVSFAARNYRVNKHLQVVNEHRRNALDTYALLAESLEGGARDAALAETLHAVFGSVDTGYLANTRETTILDTTPGLSSLLRPPGAP